jgi:hypothetical protein
MGIRILGERWAGIVVRKGFYAEGVVVTKPGVAGA